jgi:hypothetical protein
MIRAAFDLDSTLSDTRQRRDKCPTVNPRSTWSEYHAACAGDAPMPGPVALAKLLGRSGGRNYVITWRPAFLRSATEAWLHRWGVPYWHLRMRTQEDEARYGADSTAYWLACVVDLIERDLRPDLVVQDWPATALAIEALGVPVICASPLYRERGLSDNDPGDRCHDPQCRDSTWDHPCPVGPDGWELWRPEGWAPAAVGA